MSELPKGWAETPLLDVVELHDNRRIPLNSSERASKTGEYPYYGANGLVDHINEFIFDGHYVLLAEDGGNFDKPERGVAYEATGKFWVNNHAHILQPRGGISPRFLMHWLNSIDWMPFVGGSTRLKLTQAGMGKVSAPLPPLPEQFRIVAKVDALTARTARASVDLDRIPTLIARYKQRLLALAFSGELTAAWRDRAKLPPPKFMAISKISDSLRYGTAQKCYEEPRGIAVLRIPNVASGHISLDDLKYAQLEDKEIQKLRLREGDILIVRSNGSANLVGRPALVTGDAVGMAYAGYLIRVRPDQRMISPRYLTFMLEAPDIRKVIEEGARSTSGVHNVNAKELGALQIPVFHLKEQLEITRRIDAACSWLDRMADNCLAATKLLPKLDAAILAKAFRGGLAKQEPTDEPASELLARIKKADAEAPTKGRRKRRETNLMASDPKSDLLSDSLAWPPEGLAFEAISKRLSMPYDQLKEAVFTALGGEKPELVQVFDEVSHSMRLKRAYS